MIKLLVGVLVELWLWVQITCSSNVIFEQKLCAYKFILVLDHLFKYWPNFFYFKKNELNHSCLKPDLPNYRVVGSCSDDTHIRRIGLWSSILTQLLIGQVWIGHVWLEVRLTQPVPDPVATLSGCKSHFWLPSLHIANELAKAGAKPFLFRRYL